MAQGPRNEPQPRRRAAKARKAESQALPPDPAARLEARLQGRTEVLWVLGLLGVMVALRILYVVEFGGRINASADTVSFVEIARQIVGGDIFLKGQSLVFSPLYSYVLAAVFAVFGEHFLPVVILQFCLGLFGAWLTWRLARDLFGPLAALLTLALTAFYGMALAYEGQVLDASFSMLLPPAFLLVLHRASGAERLWRWAAAGAILGLFAWTRPNMLLVAPFLAAWAFLMPDKASRRWKAATAAALLAGVAAGVLPVTVRNWVQTGTPTLLTSHGGINFFIGNNPAATGFLTPPPGFEAVPGQLNQEQPKRMAEATTGRTGMTDSEVSSYWFGRGMEFIRKKPGAAFELMVRKLVIFLNGQEVEINLDLALLEEISTALRIAFVRAGLVLVLGLTGMILAAWHWRRHLHLYLYFVAGAASVVLFFVSARYRLPMVPVLLVYSGFALRQLIASLNRFAHLAGAAMLTALVASVVTIDLGVRINPAVLAHSQGYTLEGLGRIREAAERYERALRLNPNLLFTHLNLARIRAGERRLADAGRHYEAALRIDPNNALLQNEVAQFNAARQGSAQ